MSPNSVPTGSVALAREAALGGLGGLISAAEMTPASPGALTLRVTRTGRGVRSDSSSHALGAQRLAHNAGWGLCPIPQIRKLRLGEGWLARGHGAHALEAMLCTHLLQSWREARQDHTPDRSRAHHRGAQAQAGDSLQAKNPGLAPGCEGKVSSDPTAPRGLNVTLRSTGCEGPGRPV